MSDWWERVQGFLGVGEPEPEPEPSKVPLAYRPSTIGAPYPPDEPPMSPRRLHSERGWSEFEYEQENPTKLHKAMEVLGTLVDIADPGSFASKAVTVPPGAMRSMLSKASIDRFGGIATGGKVSERIGAKEYPSLAEFKQAGETLKKYQEAQRTGKIPEGLDFPDTLVGARVDPKMFDEKIEMFTTWRDEIGKEIEDTLVGRVPRTEQKWLRETHDEFVKRHSEGGIFDSSNPNARKIRRTMARRRSLHGEGKKVGLEAPQTIPEGKATYARASRDITMRPSGNMDVDVGVFAHEYGHHYQTAAIQAEETYNILMIKAQTATQDAKNLRGSLDYPKASAKRAREAATFRAEALKLEPEVKVYQRLQRAAELQRAKGGYRRPGTETEMSGDIVGAGLPPTATEWDRYNMSGGKVLPRIQPEPHSPQEPLSDLLHMISTKRGWTEMVPEVRAEMVEMFPGAAFKHGDVDFAISPHVADPDFVPGGAALDIGPGRGLPLRTQPDVDLTVGQYLPTGPNEPIDPDIDSMFTRRSRLAPGYK